MISGVAQRERQQNVGNRPPNLGEAPETRYPRPGPEASKEETSDPSLAYIPEL